MGNPELVGFHSNVTGVGKNPFPICYFLKIDTDLAKPLHIPLGKMHDAVMFGDGADATFSANPHPNSAILTCTGASRPQWLVLYPKQVKNRLEVTRLFSPLPCVTPQLVL